MVRVSNASGMSRCLRRRDAGVVAAVERRLVGVAVVADPNGQLHQALVPRGAATAVLEVDAVHGIHNRVAEPALAIRLEALTDELRQLPLRSELSLLIERVWAAARARRGRCR
jgi:hypothetical protein